MALTARRFGRLLALAGLIFYCGLLLAASIPVALAPDNRVLFMLQRGSGLLLHEVGVTPGIEVFSGRSTSRAIPKMSCFRIVGQGDTQVVLFDDLARCRERRIEAIRDPFRMLQMAYLSAAFVTLNRDRGGDLTRDPARGLFLLSDYYCHTAAAERAHVKTVSIDTVYVATNVDDGTTDELKMAGQRRCDRPTWKIR